MKQLQFGQLSTLLITHDGDRIVPADHVAVWLSDESLSDLIGIMTARSETSVDAVVRKMIKRHYSEDGNTAPNAVILSEGTIKALEEWVESRKESGAYATAEAAGEALALADMLAEDCGYKHPYGVQFHSKTMVDE